MYVLEYHTVLTMQISSKVTQLSVYVLVQLLQLTNCVPILKLPGIVAMPQFMEVYGYTF